MSPTMSMWQCKSGCPYMPRRLAPSGLAASRSGSPAWSAARWRARSASTAAAPPTPRPSASWAGSPAIRAGGRVFRKRSRSPMEPDSVEIRVLGCLIEKQRTTPDAYPLSLNALRLACNQSTNREPVVDYDEQAVVEALRRLALRGWTRLASGAGSRARKYRHLLNEAIGLDDAESWVMAWLMRLGPQTPGELKQRGQRLHDLGDLGAVHETLDRLIERELVSRHARQPGQKEDRYEQLLGEGSSEAAASTAVGGGNAGGGLDVAKATLLTELREHSLVIGEVTLWSGATAQYYVDARRALLRPAGFRAAGELIAAAAVEAGATADGGPATPGGRPSCAAPPRAPPALCRPRRARRRGPGRLLRPRRAQAARPAALGRGTGGARRPLPRRRGHRHQRRLPRRRDRTNPRAGPRDRRGSRRRRPSGRGRRGDRSCRIRPLQSPAHDRRDLPRPPR